MSGEEQTIAGGERSVAINGQVTDTYIHTGDRYDPKVNVNVNFVEPKVKRGIPDNFLIPYLPNRDLQEEALEQLLKQDIPHPLVCIIHGDQLQCHDKFLDRLREFSLRRLLKLNKDQTVQEYLLIWPNELEKLDNLKERLCKNLSKVVSNGNTTSLTETDINERFYQYHPNPTIIHTHLSSDDWSKHKFEILNKLLDFWQNWPDLIHGQKLIICVFIEYKKKRRKVNQKFSLKWIFGYLTNLPKWHHYKKINNRIDRELQELERSGIKHFNRLSCTVLTELKDISEKEVKDWIRSKETKEFVGEGKGQKMVEKVRELFENPAKQTIPMEDLAIHLTEIIKEII
jgi:hypothetical protein